MPAPKKPSTAKKPGTKKPATKKQAVKKVQTTKEKLDAFGAEAICELIADAQFYQAIAEKVGVSRGSLMVWLESHADMYARAREARADKLAEEILEIADESRFDTVVDKDGKERLDSEYVQRSKLRVDSRKWLASKMFPKKYGDVTRLEGSKENPVELNSNMTMTVDWAGIKARVASKSK